VQVGSSHGCLAKQATIQAKRSQWFSLISTTLSNLEISRAPAEAIEAIRGPVLRASERAGKRYAGGKPGDTVLDPDEQDTGEGETDEEYATGEVRPGGGPLG
jgi:hypothetical protein